MKKGYILLVLYSLTLTSIVSALVTFAVNPWIQNFKSVFCLTTALQFVVFFIYNSVLQRREEREALKMQLEIESRDIKFVTKINCSYCKTPEDVIVNLTNNENFICPYCKQENGIKVQIIPTQIIKPVENVPKNIVEAASTIV